MQRRRMLEMLLLAGALPACPGRLHAAPPVFPDVVPRPLAFPRDHGAHPSFRTEWWYITGWLEAGGDPLGFQLTFFRSRTAHDPANPSRFAPHQLLFAHAALARPKAHRLIHDQRAARLVRDDPVLRCADADTDLLLDVWQLRRLMDGRYAAQIAGADFALDLHFAPTQPLLLQGEGGFSRKGPRPEQSSYYYSQPQLAVTGHVSIANERLAVGGRAWLDHEWSSQVLDDAAAGWDWVGINFDDGGALMAFRIRPCVGETPRWASARLRMPDGRERSFGPEAVRFETLATWRSPHTGTSYPVRSRLTLGSGTSAMRFDIEPLLDDQELDARRSTGAVYWEGAVTLTESGQRRGRGYLELVGYHQPMRL